MSDTIPYAPGYLQAYEPAAATRLEINPPTGSTTPFTAPYNWLVFIGPSTASQTVTLPAAPVDGEIANISNIAPIEQFNIIPAVNGFFNGTRLEPGGLKMRYSASLGGWFIDGSAYSFTSNDAAIEAIKRRAARAETFNPLINAAASGVTVTWVNGPTGSYATFGGYTTQSGGWFNISGHNVPPPRTDLASLHPYTYGLVSSPHVGFNTYFPSYWNYPSSGTLSSLTSINEPIPGSTGYQSVPMDTTVPEFYFSATGGRVAFRTTAPAIEIHVVWVDGNNNFSVLVNGQFATPAGGLNPTADGVIRIVFTGRGERTIEIAGAGNWGFTAVYMQNPVDDISAPGALGPLWIFDGDEIVQGAGLPTPRDPDAPWYQQACHYLGVDNVLPVATPSTGYLNPGTGPYSTMRYRLENGGWMNVIDPAVVVACAGLNDLSQVVVNDLGPDGDGFEQHAYDYSALREEIVAYCLSVRARYPKALILVVPGMGYTYPLNGTDPTAPGFLLLQTGYAAKDAVAELGDPRTFYINTLGVNLEDWIYGTGYVGHTAGFGTADWAVTVPPYPNAAGHNHIAARFATAVRQIIYNL